MTTFTHPSSSCTSTHSHGGFFIHEVMQRLGISIGVVDMAESDLAVSTCMSTQLSLTLDVNVNDTAQIGGDYNFSDSVVSMTPSILTYRCQ
jgi:hypothetical protein